MSKQDGENVATSSSKQAVEVEAARLHVSTFNHFQSVEMAISLYRYIVVISVSVEWCIGKPVLIFLSSSITSYSSTSIAHSHSIILSLLTFIHPNPLSINHQSSTSTINHQCRRRLIVLVETSHHRNRWV